MKCDACMSLGGSVLRRWTITCVSELFEIELDLRPTQSPKEFQLYAKPLQNLHNTRYTA